MGWGKPDELLQRLGQSEGWLVAASQDGQLREWLEGSRRLCAPDGVRVLPGRVSLSPIGILSCPIAEFIAALFLLPIALGRLTTYVPTVSHFVTGGLSLCLSVLAG